MEIKSVPTFGMGLLQNATKIIALLFNIALLIAATYEVGLMFSGIYNGNIAIAIQDGLFALIILEMFYVVRSFIKYGKVNTGLIISVGIVAVIKELIFKLSTLSIYDSIGFSVLILSLAGALYIEYKHHFIKQEDKAARSLRRIIDEKAQQDVLTELEEEFMEQSTRETPSLKAEA